MNVGKRNRRAGHEFERELAEFFRELGFPHVVTSRSESRSRDDQKVDLINKDERKHGQFVFNVQAKNAIGHVKYAKLISEMPTDPGVINVVFHKQVERVGDRFLPRGKFVTMEMKDFEAMVKLLQKAYGYLTPEIIDDTRSTTTGVEDSPSTGV
jgi:hypothetical protein